MAFSSDVRITLLRWMRLERKTETQRTQRTIEATEATEKGEVIAGERGGASRSHDPNRLRSSSVFSVVLCVLCVSVLRNSFAKRVAPGARRLIRSDS